MRPSRRQWRFALMWLGGWLASYLGAAMWISAHAQQPGSGAQSPTGAALVGCGGGHLCASGGGTPTVTNGTATNGSTDTVGQAVASSTTMTVTFAAPYVKPPVCSIDSQTTTNAAWNVTPAAINFTTTVNGTAYTWLCLGQPGG